MFKKIKSLFSKEKPKIITETQKEKLPDIIEVPWQSCAQIKNLEESINKLHADLKDFLYNIKLKEYQTFSLIRRLEEAIEKKQKEIREIYKIPANEEYIFEVPERTGLPGFLKKKKRK